MPTLTVINNPNYNETRALIKRRIERPLYVGEIIQNTDQISARVYDLNYNNMLERQRFDALYGFDECSLDDILVEDGVRIIEHYTGNVVYTVIVGENVANVSVIATRKLAELGPQFDIEIR